MNAWTLIATGPGYTSFFSDFDTTFWSAILRIAEALVAAAPFLVAGAVVAGLMRGLIGPERLRRMLGVGHWSGPFRAWGLGVLLPICSLGALPVARELQRAKVPSGTILSFVLVAPVLNPVSIIYGLSHIAVSTLGYFAVGTFIVSVGIGALWNRQISRKYDNDSLEKEKVPRYGVARMAVAGDAAARSLVGPAFIDYGLALLAVGFLGAFLPHGVLQTGLTRDNPFAPIIMGVVAIPCYVTPTDVMMHFGHIVQDGYSLGAAFALIILGAGANVGVANWLRRDYGGRSVALFVALLIGATLVIGLTADRTITDGQATTADHTHAFDPFTRLHQIGPNQANIQWVAGRVEKEMRIDEKYGLALLGIVMLTGISLVLLGDRVSMERFLVDRPDETAEGTNKKWDPVLSSTQLTCVSVIGVLVFAVMGLYMFYPATDELLGEITQIRAELYSAVTEGDVEETRRRSAQWKLRVEKLPTSLLIRTGEVTDSQRESVDDVLYGLKTIEETLLQGKQKEAKILIGYVEKLHRSCRQQFRSAQ